MRAGSTHQSLQTIAPRTAWPRSSRPPRRYWRGRADLACLAIAIQPAHIMRAKMSGDRLKRLFTIGAILLCIALPARAQNETPAPFDGELERLAEFMGALHYLRAICGANEGQKWRNEMQALIDAEVPNAERRRNILPTFNLSYHPFPQTHPPSTPPPPLPLRPPLAP